MEIKTLKPARTQSRKKITRKETKAETARKRGASAKSRKGASAEDRKAASAAESGNASAESRKDAAESRKTAAAENRKASAGGRKAALAEDAEKRAGKEAPETEQERRQRRKELLCELVEDTHYVPMKEKELAAFLQVGREEREELRGILGELLSEGRLEISKRGKYQKVQSRLVTGSFISNRNGYGFLAAEGRQEDLFVPKDATGGAFHGDIVEALLLPGQRGRRQEARIVRIVEHTVKSVVGVFEKSRNYGFVVPDDKKLTADIFIPAGRSMGAEYGHKVVAQITDYGGERKSPEGSITEILGYEDEPGVDILSVIRSCGLPEEFPLRTLQQAERVSRPVSEADLQGRLDLRDVDMVTIDGEDAKDLDDAVSLSAEGGIYRLGVHIADVANYVQEDSALDREALNRGTSVYLVDRVIPMLPEALSNGICSLNAGEDRLALSCLMEIDERGRVRDYQIAETVIRVNRRMSYTQVKEILEDHNEARIEECGELVPMLEKMGELAALLQERWEGRGSIDFDFPEAKLILDEKGVPTAIQARERNTATRLIEAFMLAANETVAQHFHWLELPFVYRTHEDPDAEKIERLKGYLYHFGYSLRMSGEKVRPRELSRLLNRIKGSEEEALLSRLTLRSMQQAKYTTENTGHFGLACPCYCHFTSPIRRYPDLQIHRIIKEQLRGRLSDERIAHYREILPEVSRHSSEMERRAEEAERETEKLKKVQYMESRIGERYEGAVSGVTGWGLYVELENTIEGMIRIGDLPGDFFYYDEERCELKGAASGKCYRLGDKLSVCVKGTDRAARTIDFELAGE